MALVGFRWFFFSLVGYDGKEINHGYNIAAMHRTCISVCFI